MRLAVAAVAAAVALAGCTESDPQGSASPSASPTPSAASPDTARTPPEPPPDRGCYRLTLAQALRPTNSSEPVRCGRSHTARTILVGRLDTVVEGHSLGIDSAHANRQVSRSCLRRFDGYVGGSEQERRLSRFQVVWFGPTLEQFDAGADWFRCDLVAVAEGHELLPLPRNDDLRGVLDRPAALDTYGLCGTARPGSQGFRRVACRLPHTWVALSTIPIEGGRRYPGAAAVRRAGDDACADQVRERNDLLLEFSYGWEWPTRDQWEAGQRFGYCWAPSDLA
jgi:hypothetical protein